MKPKVNLFSNMVFASIAQIPYGRVTSYGHISLLAGKPRAARAVGRLLLTEELDKSLPWHRVINKQGVLSIRNPDVDKNMQKFLLLEEGITFVGEFQIDMKTYGWFEIPTIN